MRKNPLLGPPAPTDPKHLPGVSGRRALLLAPLLAACAPPPRASTAAPPKPAPPRGPVLEFSFESLDERPVSHAVLQGRASFLVFLATYGNDSLVQARFARKVFLEHVPRINAAAVFLEPVENRPLVRVFRDSADLPFPTAMGDADAIAGRGPFEGLGAVPSVLVMDPLGREVWRKIGGAPAGDIHRALNDAQREVWGPRLRRWPHPPARVQPHQVTLPDPLLTSLGPGSTLDGSLHPPPSTTHASCSWAPREAGLVRTASP